MTTDITIFDGLIELDSSTETNKNVNSLNGITDNAIKFLTLDSGVTKSEMFDKVKTQALEFLESELIGGLSTYKDFRSVIDANSKVNVSTGSDTYTAIGSSYVGCIVEIIRTPDKTKLLIKGIDFVSDRAFSTDVKVINLRSRVVHQSFPLSVIEGANSLTFLSEIELGFGEGLYFIGFIPATGTKINSLVQISETNCIKQVSGELLIDLPKIKENVTEIDVFFNVLCSIEYSYTKIIEEHKDLLATAFKYACAAVMLDRVCVSKQADRETLINREANEALAQMYREDAIKYIKNARNEIYAKMNQTGNLKTIEKKVQVNSLGSFV